MALQFKCDMALFQDFNYKLAKFGEHFGSSAPRTMKDPLLARMLLEGRMHAFSLCHVALSDFLKAIYNESDLSKRDGAHPEQAIGDVLGALHKEGMISYEDLVDFVDQFQLGKVLTYDREWLEGQDQQRLFDEHVKKLPRYYYRMSTFSGNLTQRLTVIRESAHARV